jgi:hypothetical protein
MVRRTCFKGNMGRLGQMGQPQPDWLVRLLPLRLSSCQWTSTNKASRLLPKRCSDSHSLWVYKFISIPFYVLRAFCAFYFDVFWKINFWAFEQIQNGSVVSTEQHWFYLIPMEDCRWACEHLFSLFTGLPNGLCAYTKIPMFLRYFERPCNGSILIDMVMYFWFLTKSTKMHLCLVKPWHVFRFR